MMNLFSFSANFGTGESCRMHLKTKEIYKVFKVKAVVKTIFLIKSVWSYECKKRYSRISLRSETIMQSSNLSFLIRYKTMILMAACKGFSSKEIKTIQFYIH